MATKLMTIPSVFFRGCFMGLLERFFFTLAVAFNIPGVGVAMLAWIAAKMAANWNNRKPSVNITEDDLKSDRLSALQGGITSMLFALPGGLVCAGRI